MSTDGIEWAEVDRLLDQALELDAAECLAFVRAQPEPMRSALQQALVNGEDSALESSAARAVVEALSRLDPDLLDTTQFRDWQIIETLGAGGMAQVYHARRQRDGFSQDAALKVLFPFRVSNAYRDRFVRERSILAQLDHPGIARLLDGGTLKDGRPWFAMELVDGIDIAKACAERDLEQRLELFGQVCDALSYAHGRLFLHRDIKPDNILVDTEGRVRLLDFGIARILDAVDQIVVTQTLDSFLTLQYASPEQVQRSATTVASDVYQLGVLLYQLVTGSLPYDLRGKSLHEALQLITEVEPPLPRSLCPIDADLESIILKAMRKPPAERYASVATLHEDLQNYRSGYPVKARPRSSLYSARRFVARHRAWVAAATIMSASLVLAAVISVLMAQQATRQAARSEQALAILGDVFERADPFAKAGDDLTLKAALQQSVPRIRTQVEGDPVLAVNVFNRLGDTFSALGMHQEALDSYETVLSQPGLESQPVQQAHAGAGQAVALSALGQFTNLIEISEDWTRDPGDASIAPFWVDRQLSLASALRNSNEIARGKQAVESARATADAYSVIDPDVRMRLHSELSSTARASGDVEAGLEHLRTALTYARQANRPDSTAILTQNLALQLGKLRRYEESEELFKEAMEIVDTHAPGHINGAETRVNYAGLLYRTDRQAQAISLLKSVMPQIRSSDDRHLLVYANRDLAGYSYAQGDFESALDAIDVVLENGPKAYGEGSANVLRAQMLLARILSLGGYSDLSLEWMTQVRSAESHEVARTDDEWTGFLIDADRIEGLAERIDTDISPATTLRANCQLRNSTKRLVSSANAAKTQPPLASWWQAVLDSLHLPKAAARISLAETARKLMAGPAEWLDASRLIAAIDAAGARVDWLPPEAWDRFVASNEASRLQARQALRSAISLQNHQAAWLRPDTEYPPNSLAVPACLATVRPSGR